MDSLYREDILQLFKNPHNFGTMENADITITDTNATCGDEITIYIKLTPDKQRVKDVKYVCFGCLVCITSSSIFTDMMKGKTLAEVKQITFEEVNKTLKLPVVKGKWNCCNLSIKAVERGLNDYEARQK